MMYKGIELYMIIAIKTCKAMKGYEGICTDVVPFKGLPLKLLEAKTLLDV
jgi:hypothetical protein